MFLCQKNVQKVHPPAQPSWVWISAGSTKRREVGVMGDETMSGVRAANCICARFALLALTAVIHGIYWCVTHLQ